MDEAQLKVIFKSALGPDFTFQGDLQAGMGLNSQGNFCLWMGLGNCHITATNSYPIRFWAIAGTEIADNA